MPNSRMCWRGEHFNGTDWDHNARKHAIYKLISEPSNFSSGSAQTYDPAGYISIPSRRRHSSGSRNTLSREILIRYAQRRKERASLDLRSKRSGRGWAEDVDDQNGNDDYLMFSNIDYSHLEVREDVLRWGSWMAETVGVDGFRLDAAQHISYSFLHKWIEHIGEAVQRKTEKDAFVVGEVWTGELYRIKRWLDSVQPSSGSPIVRAFDAPLLYNFSKLSEDVRRSFKSSHDQTPSRRQHHKQPDLRKLLENSLVKSRPKAAVTVVTNHDTQPGQTCATPMNRRLKPLFYAFTLLRKDGLPCVFWGDVFGTKGPHAEGPVGVADSQDPGNTKSLLADLTMCRKLFAYGEQEDYWHSATCISWTRAGTGSNNGCAVILSIHCSNSPNLRSAEKMRESIKMRIGTPDEVWTDILRAVEDDVTIDQSGFGSFPIAAPGVSVFVRRESALQHEFPVHLDLNVYVT
jgi:alpha-amylase